MKIWITGNRGFLGGHIHDQLSMRGHTVFGNDNLLCSSRSDTHSIDVDCSDYCNMRQQFDIFKPEVIYHCAATAHEGLSNFSPSFITKNIYEASVSMFSAAIASGVRRIIFMSSMARYGSQTLPFHEAQTPKPVDPYGIAKVAAEDTLKALCNLHDIEYVIAVPHNIIGINQKYNDPFRNVASIMINRCLQNKKIIIYGDGLQKRCFSPIDDCLDSLIKMIDAPISGEIINIGPDKGEITVLELAQLIQNLCWKYVAKLPFQHMNDRPNEVKEAYCSSSKARKLLDFSPKQSIVECLNQMVDQIYKSGCMDFAYNFPIEIEKGCPETWIKKLI